MKNLLSRVHRASKTDFVKVSSWSAIATLVKMLSGVVSTKVAAFFIGPSGMATVGNFINSINIISVLGTGGIGQGVTKYIAEHYDEPVKRNKIIANAVRITFYSTLVVSIFVLIFSRALGNYIFKTDQYTSVIILFACSIILYSFNMLITYIVNGFKAYKKFIRINIISSAAALILSILLVSNYGLYGALLNCVLSQSIIIIVAIIFVSKEEWFKEFFSLKKLDLTVVKQLARFTVMTLVSVIMIQVSQFSIRNYITDHISIRNAGMWEAMNRISAMYLMVVTTSISTYYLPRLAEIKDDVILRNEIIRTMKIVLPPLMLGCFAIFLTKDILIWILFTKEFNEVRDLFGFQMIGDFFKISSWLIAFLFWAKAMTRTFIFTEVGFNLLLIGISILFIRQFGLIGSVYAYALNYFIYFLVIIFLFRKLLRTS